MKPWRLLSIALLAACASAPAPAGPAALRGCWIERRGEQTITQRWFPERGGAWRGDELTYFASGAEPDAARWRLKPDGAGGWLMCMVETKPTAPPCWRAVFGAGRAENEDDRWVEIDAGPERLRIAYVTPPDRAVTYESARDGCD
jgi:hypothetical protein